MQRATVKVIVESLGRDDLCEHLGVGKFALKHVLNDGRFPASWYAVVSDLCKARSIECPLELFNFKEKGAA